MTQNDEQSPLLTQQNWKEAVVRALDELPADLRDSVGYSDTSGNRITLTIAVEPVLSADDVSSEFSPSRIEITFWQSMREQGWPTEYDRLYGPGGSMNEQSDWPVISIDCEADGTRKGLYPGRSSVCSLIGDIQLAILEALYSGGAMSLVSKDSEGCFIREDGTKILDWQ